MPDDFEGSKSATLSLSNLLSLLTPPHFLPLIRSFSSFFKYAVYAPKVSSNDHERLQALPNYSLYLKMSCMSCQGFLAFFFIYFYLLTKCNQTDFPLILLLSRSPIFSLPNPMGIFKLPTLCIRQHFTDFIVFYLLNSFFICPLQYRSLLMLLLQHWLHFL